MIPNLTAGAIEAIITGDPCDKPLLQVISSKKISGSGNSNERYRLLLSDGHMSYSHAMLATQLNSMIDSGEVQNMAVVQVNKYLCNTIQENRRVMIILDMEVVASGSEVGSRIGNPQAYKMGESNAASSNANTAAPRPNMNGGHNAPSNVANRPAASNPYIKPAAAPVASPSSGFKVRGGGSAGGPSTPGSSRVHSIASLTPYQNRWKIKARVTQKSNIRTWSNSRGEGRLFNVNLLDDSGEIRATGFTDSVDKFYEMIEVNKVYFFSRATLKTANKQYSSVANDYEMTFNADTQIELCEEECDLPTMTFEFVKINELESKQANAMIDVIGVVKGAGDVATVTGRQSQKEVSKRDLNLVDQSGMVVNATIWGSDAEKFDPSGAPVLAIKGCRLSDWGGRSISVLASSQMVVNPDIRESHLLRGWFDREGHAMDFSGYRSEGGSGGGSGTNWKSFGQIKSENIGQGDKPEYFTSKGMVIFLRKENCMYMACPTENCNKKVVDQGNGMYRCEKCNKEFPNFKHRMILGVNLADYSDNQWVTCFQESAEMLLGTSADELGNLKDTNEAAFDQVFQEAIFKSYVFKLRAKTETYNDESRLKTVCVDAKPMDWREYGKKLIEDISKMVA